MRIMYLLFSFTVGGTEKLVSDICNEMNRLGHTVFLYIVNQHYSKEMLMNIELNVKIELQNRAVGKESVTKTIRKIEQFVKNNRIEIIHCNSFDSPELLFLTKIFHPTVKVIYTIHDVHQWCNLNRVRSVYRNLICTKIIAISDCVKRDIIKSGARLNKTIVVYNAINLTKFEKRAIEKKFTGLTCFESSYNKENLFVIGNVARIVPPKKGQDILVNAIAQVKEKYPQIRCIFAGEIPKEQQKELDDLKKLVKELNLKDEVQFAGNITDVPGFLSKLDLFILPSRFEGFGISLIEAMAMGIPCIASALDGPAEIVGKQERGLLFPPGNVDILAQKIEYAIEHYDEMLKAADVATKYVVNNFDIQDMCKQLEIIYRSKK